MFYSSAATNPLPKPLGYAGLVPQLIAVLMLFDEGGLRWIAIAGGFGYAALIFSFLGGIWWGLALRENNPPQWIYGVAILPSLIALATYLPWTWGWDWPVPSLWVLVVCLILSPSIDVAISKTIPLPSGWIKMRIQLSLGLGFLTAILAFA
jgi:hypothetical protein